MEALGPSNGRRGAPQGGLVETQVARGRFPSCRRQRARAAHRAAAEANAGLERSGLVERRTRRRALPEIHAKADPFRAACEALRHLQAPRFEILVCLCPEQAVEIHIHVGG